MKILLTHGYFLKEDEKELQVMKPYPPLGLLSISAYLEKNHFDNQVFDSTFHDFDTLKKKLLEFRPDVIIGIYTNLMTKLNVLRIIQFIKTEKTLSTKIILGGPEGRNHKENFLKHGADIIVFGEGEETMLNLCQILSNKTEQNLLLVNGIAFLDEKQNTIVTAERELIREIDELPYPNRSKIDLQKYFDTWKMCTVRV